MSVRNGLGARQVLVRAVGNTSGLWIGNANPITYLDVGTYLVVWNVSCVPDTNTDIITTSQFAITVNQPFLTPGYLVVASSTILNGLGMVAGNELLWEIMNVYTITANNTPIYAYQNCILSTAGVLAPTHTWSNGALANEGYNMARVNFIKLS